MTHRTTERKVKNTNTAYAGYDKLAPVFDEEWGDFASQVFSIHLKLARRKISDGAKILDLCCGTGQLARVLSERGYKVTGLDGSPEMVRLAKKNSPDSEFVLEDARSFRLPAVFKAVFCTYDSLNHLMNAKDFKTTLRNVYDCLVFEGLFLFDLNTLKAYREQWDGYAEVREKPGRLYLNRAYYDPGKKIARTHGVLFRRQGKNWQRTDVRLYQKYHAITRVHLWLRNEGFAQIQKYGINDRGETHEFTEEDSRVFIICQKRRRPNKVS